MAGAIPRSRKPSEQLRRRNAPEQWTALPADGCKLAPPAWPSGKASADETKLWKRLWALPVAVWWREQSVEPFVVARYVRLAVERPEHASTSQLERELGLTPAAMQRMRLLVEAPEVVEAEAGPDPYGHLRPKFEETE